MPKELKDEFPTKAEPTEAALRFVADNPDLLKAMANNGSGADPGTWAAVAAAAKNAKKAPKA